MRKIFAALIVLSLASVVNAELIFAVNGADAPGGITASIGDIINLGVIGVEGTNPPVIAPWIIVKGSLSIDGATVLYTGSGIPGAGYYDDDAVVYNGYSGEDLIAILENDFGYIGIVDYSYMILGDVGTGPGGSLIPLDGLLVTDINLLVAGNGSVILLDDNFQVEDSMEVVVPEPMTIVLLGLGGFFLRHRR